MTFSTTLQGGVLNTTTIGPASIDRGYIIEVTPLNGVVSFGLEVRRVVPQWDGSQWNDVVELRTNQLHPDMQVSVRLYDTGALQLVNSFTPTLLNGVLHGFILGASAQNRGYVAEITPIGQTPTQFVDVFIQPEWNGTTWFDVIRISTQQHGSDIQANVRIYATDALPIATEFTTTLQTGGFQGFTLGSASLDFGYVAELTPITQGGGIQTNRIQPEWDGTAWFDVLRLGTTDPPMQVHVRVYRIAP
jgi:hypothetical protein